MASKLSLDSLRSLDPRLTYSDDEDNHSENVNNEENQRLILTEDAGLPRKHKVMESRTEIHKESRWPKWWPLALRPSRFLSWLLVLFIFCVLLLVVINVHSFRYRRPKGPYGESPPWYPTPRGGIAAEWAKSYEMATALVKQMNLVEKVNITTGTGWMMGMCVGNTAPVIRLGFPSLCLQDGPLGIRFADNITAFPAGITTGATWNRDLIRERGQALGREARLKGINVMLGPAMGPLGRSPLGGRNWEGFGSDPVLQGIAAAETIKGIQSEGVIATAKHWIGNEQEHYRQSWEWGTPDAISSNIDDRTLHEIYGWPFQDSVRAGVGSVMCAYNQVNNSYACQNSKLMNGVLKDEYGFQGFIQSDWLAQRSGVASALAGLDMSMPGDGLGWQDGQSLWGSSLTTAILNGSIPIVRLDDMVTRIVAAWYQMGQNDRKRFKGGPNFSSWTNETFGLLRPGSDDESTGRVNKFVNVQGEGVTFHSLTARNVAIEGTVLVKNDNSFLPITSHGYSKAAGAVSSASGKRKIGVFGSAAFPDPNGPNSCKDRACMDWAIGSGWGSGAVEFPYLVAPYTALKRLFNNATAVKVSKFESNKLSGAEIEALKEQDLCFVFLMSNGGEGYLAADGVKADRNDLSPQKGGEKLVQTVSDQCGGGKGEVVVVIHSVGPVLVENFIDKPTVKAVLFANLPAEESGNALTDILRGVENPSGRLPYTIGKKIADYGPSANIVKTVLPIFATPQADFEEGFLIDYRHFDHNKIEPRFEFGYGLSYTTYSLSGLEVDIIKAKSPFLDPRPKPAAQPPNYNTSLPGVSTTLFPPGFRRLKKFIYPYLSSDDGITYNPPESPTQHPLSPAGGAQGGNPALFDTHLNISVTVQNTGAVAGAAVVQLYVNMPRNFKDTETKERINFPVRVLRNFDKVRLTPGEKKQVTLSLTRRDLSYWSVTRQNWVMPTKRRIGFEVGFSSRDLPLKGGF
jgi:beta-glucosidase